MGSDSLQFRVAQEQDCRFVWEVNNHPSVRQNAIDQSDIPWSEHQRWFERVMGDDTILLWIVSCAGEDSGVVRFDLEGAVSTITIALSPQSRGKGLGTRSIAEATASLFAATDIDTVVALVRPGNAASHRAFLSAGYVEDEEPVVEGGAAFCQLRACREHFPAQSDPGAVNE